MELFANLLKKFNKTVPVVISNFFAFFLFLFEKFSFMDPDPGGKINADPDPQPCFLPVGSRSKWSPRWTWICIIMLADPKHWYGKALQVAFFGFQYSGVQGVLIQHQKDLCDCLEEECPGCHFPCPK